VLDQIPLIDVTSLFINRRLELYGQPGFFAAIGPNSLPFSSYSIGVEGIGPYINAVILINFVALISSRVRGMVRHDQSRIRLQKWTRALALLLALGQAYGWTVLGQSVGALPGAMDWSSRLFACLALTGGTAVMILLAGALDEHGLGFGYGAWILYALGYVATEVHRLAGYLATTPSIEALYRPLAVWAIFTIGTTVAAVAVLLAVRRLTAEHKTVELRLLTPGVVRPPYIAFSLMFQPVILANYNLGNSFAQQFVANWNPLGPSVWLDVVYVAIETAFILAFAVFTAQVDYWMLPGPPQARQHIPRLALLGGGFLVLATVAVPVAAHMVIQPSGTSVSVSGYDVVLVTALALIVVRAIAGHRAVAPLGATPFGIP
jgi:preprotein translocase subunit SecY